MTAEDTIKVTVYGKGGHGAKPQHTIDPVVLAAMTWSGCRPSCPARSRRPRSRW